MSDDIVENLKEPSQWFRVAFMVVFAVVLYVVGLVLTLLTVAQVLFSLLTGSDNENLRALGKDLSTYVHQILAFLTYNSDNKPFPFATYPSTDESAAAAQSRDAGFKDAKAQDAEFPDEEYADTEVDLDFEVNIEEGTEPGAAPKPARAPRKSVSGKPVPPTSEDGETI